MIKRRSDRDDIETDLSIVMAGIILSGVNGGVFAVALNFLGNISMGVPAEWLAWPVYFLYGGVFGMLISPFFVFGFLRSVNSDRGLLRWVYLSTFAMILGVFVLSPFAVFYGSIGVYAASSIAVGIFSPRAIRFAPHQCAACGYDLRGLAEGVCPECGTVEPRSID